MTSIGVCIYLNLLINDIVYHYLVFEWLYNYEEASILTYYTNPHSFMKLNVTSCTNKICAKLHIYEM